MSEIGLRNLPAKERRAVGVRLLRLAAGSAAPAQTQAAATAQAAAWSHPLSDSTPLETAAIAQERSENLLARVEAAIATMRTAYWHAH